MNENNHTVCLVAEPGICNNTARQPYRATYVTYDNATMTASITASNWTWEEALPEWRLRIKSEGIMANTSSDSGTLGKRVDQMASIPITQTFNANIANLTAGDVTASLDCIDCGTMGTLNFDFDVGFSLTNGLTGTASLTPSGVGAAVTLGLTVSAALTQELSSSLTIADIPLGGGIDIVGIKVGPQLVVAATAGITSVTAATTISFGVLVNVPDDSLAKVDFSDSSNNQFNRLESFLHRHRPQLRCKRLDLW